MKKLILLVAATAMINLAFCQVSNINDNQNTIKSLTYRLKAKKQKTAAWICLGGGFALMTTAVVIDLANVPGEIVSTLVFGEEDQSNSTASTILSTIGGVAMLGSIPLFISAAKNKHKAKFTMTQQKTAIGLPIQAPKKVPSLTLSISI